MFKSHTSSQSSHHHMPKPTPSESTGPKQLRGMLSSVIPTPYLSSSTSCNLSEESASRSLSSVSPTSSLSSSTSSNLSEESSSGSLS